MLDNKSTLVRIVEDGRTQFHMVDDFTILNGVISFTIGITPYKYEFSLLAYQYLTKYNFIDCSNLKAINF